MSAILRKLVKTIALVPGLVERRRHDDVVVLIYHRIGQEREVDVPAKAFDTQLQLLTEKGLCLAMEARDERGGVLVTFDDGYRDFCEQALPLLVKHDVPAVLYLQTGLVANGGGTDPAALTWTDLRDAASTGLVTIGAHTHSHPNLSLASENEAEREMRKSKEIIEDKLGVECRHFAYPFGVGSKAADRAARRLFHTAALGDWRVNRSGQTDPFRIGRTPVLRSDGTVFFRAKAAGMLSAEALAYRVLARGPWRHS
jgi:peptidoglycan/xylan/chitin deacetylase (PgdA/CDA1 family)